MGSLDRTGLGSIDTKVNTTLIGGRFTVLDGILRPFDVVGINITGQYEDRDAYAQDGKFWDAYVVQGEEDRGGS